MSQFAQPFAARAPRFETANRQGKPRVGFLVTQGHEKAFLSSIGGVLNQLETNSKDLFVICQHASTGILRTTLNGAIATVDLPRDWNQLVKVLQELQLDVLYYWEIGSDSINYFLPFARMAPIQCTSFGLQFSSGIPSVDFYVSSHWIEPANYQDFYSESVLLGESLLLAREPIQHTAFSPTEDELLIGCLHQIGKFHPDWDATLATILRRSPKAKLVVLADLSGRTAVELQQRFVCTVPDVVDRICFQPRLAKRDYLSLLQRMTLLLDPPVFAGTNSSLDALEIGCPIVSQPGPDQRGRFTLACYRRMQMDTLIAKNTDEYIEMAVRLLHDVDFNRESRRQIHESNHVLFDGPGIVTDYEAILGQLIDVSRRSRGSSLGWDPSSPNQFPN